MKLLLRLFAVAVTLSALVAYALGTDGWVSLGTRPTGERLERMSHSAQFLNGRFENPQPLQNAWIGSLTAMFSADENVHPKEPPAHEIVEPGRFDTASSTVRATWFGHSSTLVEIEGHRVLTDPIWSDRAGPVTWAGPTRWFERPITLDALPPIDVVVISHDHYDHMDYKTVLALKDTGVPFVVPLGLGAHLSEWGVKDAQIVELDWWEKTRIKSLDIVCTPARHASGRGVFDKDMTLWAGYALLGASHRVYYSGDTGLFPAMKDIGQKYGPFDLTMIEVGQYNKAWPDWHIGPEQAVKAHRWVNGKLFLPVHWGLFELAAHGWTEPIERAVAEAKKTEVAIVTPKPGQSITTDAPPPQSQWWPTLPIKTEPIVSTQVE